MRLEGCRIGMCDFMDYIGSIIFGIFFGSGLSLSTDDVINLIEGVGQKMTTG